MATSQAAEWHSQDDLENDLWYYSEISDGKDSVQEPPSASILQWRAQVSSDRSSSIFDNPHYNEDVTYVCSGRGRGGVSKIFRPGLPLRDVGMMEEDVIKRKIREVSGLGYSNEFIEKSIRAKNGIPQDFEDADTDRHDDRSSCSSGSRTTPRDNSGSRITPRDNSGSTTTYRDNSGSLSSYRDNSGSLSSRRPNDGSRTSSPRTAVPLQEFPPLPVSPVRAREEKPKTPPPLSVILGRQRNRNAGRRLADDAPIVTEPKEDDKKDDMDNGRTNGLNTSRDDSSAAEDSNDSGTTNDFWWRNGTSGSTSEDSLSWRSGPRGSPNRGFNGNHWRRDCNRRGDSFDIKSSDQFPAL